MATKGYELWYSKLGYLSLACQVAVWDLPSVFVLSLASLLRLTTSRVVGSIDGGFGSCLKRYLRILQWDLIISVSKDLSGYRSFLFFLFFSSIHIYTEKFIRRDLVLSSLIPVQHNLQTCNQLSSSRVIPLKYLCESLARRE